MKKVNQKASKILTKILAAAKGEYAKLTAGSYMDLNVDVLEDTEKYTLFAMAHNYIQNGDVMADPDVEIFYSKDLDAFFPIAIQHATGHYLKAAWIVNGVIEKFRPRAQRELATFVGTWAANIKAQGFLA